VQKLRTRSAPDILLQERGFGRAWAVPCIARDLAQTVGRESKIAPYEHPCRGRRHSPSPGAVARVNTSRRAGRSAATRLTVATVLFADLRGYTGMAEILSAYQVLPLLDEFQRTLAAATETFGGTVFHLAGDGMMAGFGVNEKSGNGAREALAAGHAMLKDFAPIAARWRTELEIDAGIGIGLHLGEVAVGVLGPPRHKATTLVGDTVNVAARLCSRARAGEVLFSCTVATALDGDAPAAGAAMRAVSNGGATAGPMSATGAPPFLQLPKFELRGRRGPIDIWCVPAPARLAL
jgi:class 3 adenylate cyclase